jgi:hypothetical protein
VMKGVCLAQTVRSLRHWNFKSERLDRAEVVGFGEGPTDTW